MAATAGARPMIISDLLCFTVNKFSRIAIKLLKSVLIDFYNSDNISAAKELLSSEIDKIQSDKWPKPARRRKDSYNKSQLEIDDIIQMLTAIDNSKLLNDLPLFVSSDPDRMPTIRLTEGDLAVVMLKLSKLENTQDTICKNVDEIRRNASLPRTTSTRPINNALHSSFTARLPVDRPANSAPNNVSAVNWLGSSVTSDAAETSDNEGFQFQRTSKRKKPSASPSYAAALTQSSARPSIPQQSKVKPKVLIGASSTCPLKASKSLIVNKTVFRLGNIDSVYSETDIEHYIRSLDIRLLSCFELKNSARQPADNKAFRICIVSDDTNKFCKSDNWSVGVSIREWIHKPKSDNQNSVASAVLQPGSDSMITDDLGSVINQNATVVCSKDYGCTA
jgi:hypothetical protein